jgi:hypothetical protein
MPRSFALLRPIIKIVLISRERLDLDCTDHSLVHQYDKNHDARYYKEPNILPPLCLKVKWLRKLGQQQEFYGEYHYENVDRVDVESNKNEYGKPEKQEQRVPKSLRFGQFHSFPIFVVDTTTKRYKRDCS